MLLSSTSPLLFLFMRPRHTIPHRQVFKLKHDNDDPLFPDRFFSFSHLLSLSFTLSFWAGWRVKTEKPRAKTRKFEDEPIPTHHYVQPKKKLRKGKILGNRGVRKFMSRIGSQWSLVHTWKIGLDKRKTGFPVFSTLHRVSGIPNIIEHLLLCSSPSFAF